RACQLLCPSHIPEKDSAMTRASRSTLVTFACAFAAVLSTTPRVRAAAPPEHAGVGLKQYGDIVVRDLPRGPAQHGASRAIPFRPTNRDAFRRQKSSTEIQAPPTLGSIAPGSPTLAVTDAGFDGISFGDAGAIPPDTQIAVG